MTAGVKPTSVLTRLSEALADSYGPDYRDACLERLRGHMARRAPQAVGVRGSR